MQLSIISTFLLTLSFATAKPALIRNEAELRKQSPIFEHPVKFEKPGKLPVTKTQIKTKYCTRFVVDTQTMTTTADVATPTGQESTDEPLVRVTYATEDTLQTARGEKACATCHKCRAFYDCRYSDKECQKSCDVSRNCIECQMWTAARMSNSYGFNLDIDYPKEWEVSMEVGDNGVIELRAGQEEKVLEVRTGQEDA